VYAPFVLLNGDPQEVTYFEVEVLPDRFIDCYTPALVHFGEECLPAPFISIHRHTDVFYGYL